MSLALVFALTGCVKVVPVTGITLDQLEATVEVGSTVKLRAEVEPADAFDTRVYWETSDADVATVDKRGNVTGVAEGTAVISAETSDGRYFAECIVTVVAKDIIWDGNTPTEQPDGFETPDPEDPKADPNLIVINDTQALAYFAAQVNEGNTFVGKTVKLARDLDLNNQPWTPIKGTMDGYSQNSFAGVFDGDGHTIFNLTTAADRATNTDVHAADGLFGTLAGTVKNLTLKNVTVTGTHYVGGIVGYISLGAATVDNCSVDGAKLTSVPVMIGDAYDNGDKVGGIVGYVYDGEIKNCTVKNATIRGYRDLGGIAGMADYAVTTVSDCAVTDSYVISDQHTNSYGAKAVNAAEIVGRNNDVDVSSCTATNVVISSEIAEGLVLTNGVYEISSANGLKYFAANATALSKNADSARLVEDIDLSETEWGAYIWSIAAGKTFTLDGNGKTVSNFEATQTANCAGFTGAGLFAGVDSNFPTPGTLVIKDLTMSGAMVAVPSTQYASSYAVLIGINNVTTLTFENVAVKDSTVTSPYYAGALLGADQGGKKISVIGGSLVENCEISGNDATGALAGINYSEEFVIDTVAVKSNSINGGAGWSAAALVGTTNKLVATDVTAEGNIYSMDSEKYDAVNAPSTPGYKFNAGEYGLVFNLAEYSINGTSYVTSTALKAVLTPDQGLIKLTQNYVLVDDAWVPFLFPTGSIYEPISGPYTIDGGKSDGTTCFISGLTKPLLAGNCAHDMVIKNLTIKDSVVAPDFENGMGNGAFVAYMDNTGITFTMENCHLRNSTVNGNSTGTGGLIGYVAMTGEKNYAAPQLVIKDCSVKGCTINGKNNAAGIVGFCTVANNMNGMSYSITGCEVESSTITSLKNEDWRVGAIFGTVNGNGTLNMNGCAASSVTLCMENTSAEDPGHVLYGRIVAPATLKIGSDEYTAG